MSGADEISISRDAVFFSFFFRFFRFDSSFQLFSEDQIIRMCVHINTFHRRIKKKLVQNSSRSKQKCFLLLLSKLKRDLHILFNPLTMSYFSPPNHRYSPALPSPGSSNRHHPYAYQPAGSPHHSVVYYHHNPNHCFNLRKMLWDRTKQLPKELFKQVKKKKSPFCKHNWNSSKKDTLILNIKWFFSVLSIKIISKSVNNLK